MALLDELLEIEQGFWNATRDPGYYKEHMADEGLAIFSAGVMDKSQAIASTSAPGMAAWTGVKLSNPRVVELAKDCAALVYEGSATRDGQPYSANSTSVYTRRNGSWQMMLHQQSSTGS